MAFDWLFQGSPTPNITGSTVSESSLPSWYQDYVKQLIMRSSEVAAQPYQAYEGPRIADFTGMQTQAQDMAQNVASNYQPYINSATTMANQAAVPAYQGAQNYMNPFLNDYMGRVADLNNRNLTEKVIPGINTTFTGANQFGSSRNSEFMSRALRDNQEAIANANSQASLQAWNQANTSAATDASNAARASQVMGGLGQMQQQGDLRGMAALDTMGGQQQQLNQQSLDLGYQDFLAQQQWPFQQAGWMSEIVRGMAPTLPTQTAQTSNQGTGTYSPGGLNQMGQYLSFMNGLGKII
jgi:hypothetical protein